MLAVGHDVNEELRIGYIIAKGVRPMFFGEINLLSTPRICFRGEIFTLTMVSILSFALKGSLSLGTISSGIIDLARLVREPLTSPPQCDAGMENLISSAKASFDKPFFMEAFAVAAWNIWKQRNLKGFDNIRPSLGSLSFQKGPFPSFLWNERQLQTRSYFLARQPRLSLCTTLSLYSPLPFLVHLSPFLIQF